MATKMKLITLGNTPNPKDRERGRRNAFQVIKLRGCEAVFANTGNLEQELVKGHMIISCGLSRWHLSKNLLKSLAFGHQKSKGRFGLEGHLRVPQGVELWKVMSSHTTLVPSRTEGQARVGSASPGWNKCLLWNVIENKSIGAFPLPPGHSDIESREKRHHPTKLPRDCDLRHLKGPEALCSEHSIS